MGDSTARVSKRLFARSAAHCARCPRARRRLALSEICAGLKHAGKGKNLGARFMAQVLIDFVVEPSLCLAISE
jgi:hypothetical protein